MKTVLLILAVLAVGCNRGEFNTVCKTDLVGLAGGESEELVCGRLIYDIGVVRKIMMTEQTRDDGSKFTTIRSEAEWGRIFFGASVWVGSTKNISNPYGIGDEVGGSYNDLTGEIRVDKSMITLLHECYHRVDVMRGNTIPTTFHDHWDTNGYNKMDEEKYKRKYLGSDVEFRSREINGFLDQGDTL